MIQSDWEERQLRARHALDGLSIGDAFGQCWMMPCFGAEQFKRELPPAPWRYTDDTEMAMALVSVLEDHHQIDQDVLARRFAQRFISDPTRGYGEGARRLLSEIARGGDWSLASKDLFGGTGSYGNGGAMRVAPLGAWFADDLAMAAEHARRSAAVTHAHHEGQAGAIAVAVAAAWASARKLKSENSKRAEMFEAVLAFTPESQVREGLLEASQWGLDEWHHEVANNLGNGSRITAQDTVPFCVWAAAANLDNFVEAMWITAGVGGDIDTNCAIVGGIVACAIDADAIPTRWRKCRESLNW